jgi:hypothetical protein
MRSRVLSDYRSGLSQVVVSSARRPDNYILITSVPFTGTPRTGLFDRVEALKGALGEQYSVRLDLWDGLEIEALLLKYPRLADHVRRRALRGSARVEAPKFHEVPAAVLLLAGATERELTDLQVLAMLDGLIGELPNPLMPGSRSWLWNAYMGADNRSARALISAMTRAVGRRAAHAPELSHSLTWLQLTWAAIEARLGSPKAARKLAIQSKSRSTDPSVRAWALNIESIAEGKLDRVAPYRRASDEALRASEESGDQWLWASIRLRILHKQSWSLGESGQPMENSVFGDEIEAILGRDWGMAPDTREHLAAQVDAYTGLQLSWHTSEWATAERAIRSADARFREIGDYSELARIRAERGRLYLLGGAEPAKTVGAVLAGAQQRLRQGELPRLRYDLLWLGQAYSRLPAEVEAQTCWCLGLAIHDQLYRSAKIDSKIVRALDDALQSSTGSLQAQARSRRFTHEFCVGLLSSSLQIDETELAYLVDVERFRSFASECFA